MADASVRDPRDRATRVYGQIVSAPGVRTVPFYFVNDTSASMEGLKIAQANAALAEAVPLLQDQERSLCVHFEIKLLQVGGAATWLAEDAARPDDFKPPRFAVSGRTPFGAAFDLLAVEMAQLDARASERRDILAPAILIVSDGQPNDAWEEPLERLLATAAGRASRRLATAIGEDCRRDILARFTGDPEMVYAVTELYEMAATIRACTLTLSRLAATGVRRAASDGAAAALGGASDDFYTRFVDGFSS